MSILKAMYSGVSGLGAEGGALGVVGDNIANSNTIGFKESRALFEDVLGGAVGQQSIGSGVRMLRAQQIFAQGTMLNTSQPTDLALSGDGFFVVNGSLDGVKGNYYTRAGQTSLRNDGTLINPEGMELQGYAANPDGTFASAVSSIKLSTAALPPKMTSALTITANLDGAATTPTAAWDPLKPTTTSNFPTSMKVYDSLGNGHQVDVYFRKTGTGTWEYHALAPGADVVGGTAGTPSEIATGTLTFNSAGALDSVSTSTGGTVDWNGATPGQPLAFDFGTPISAGGTGLDGTTQFAAPSNVSSQSQDGYASGDLAGVKVDSDGTVNGVYTNGQTIAAGRLAIAKFRANDGLARAGHDVWAASKDSGEPALGVAGSGGRATVVAGALEQSNVDIAQQFVDLIAHQRSFQANSKTITTADEMLQELVNLKR